jgi:hypothetical protein
VGTPSGQVIVVFREEGETMRLIARYIGEQLGGIQRINLLCMEFSSLQEVAREFKKAFFLNGVTFLMESDPVVAELVAGLRQRGY